MHTSRRTIPYLHPLKMYSHKQVAACNLMYSYSVTIRTQHEGGSTYGAIYVIWFHLDHNNMHS